MSETGAKAMAKVIAKELKAGRSMRLGDSPVSVCCILIDGIEAYNATCWEAGGRSLIGTDPEAVALTALGWACDWCDDDNLLFDGDQVRLVDVDAA